MRRAFIFTERGIHKIPLVWERDCDLPGNAETLIAKAMGQDGARFGRVGVSLKGAGRAKLIRRFPSDDREFCAVMFDSTPFSKSGMGYLMSTPGVALFHKGEFVEVIPEHLIEWTSGSRPEPKL